MIVWCLPYPQATNAPGDKATGRAAFHAFELDRKQQEAANLQVAYDVLPLCKSRRWTGAVGPTFTSPEQTPWRRCKKCVQKQEKSNGLR